MVKWEIGLGLTRVLLPPLLIAAITLAHYLFLPEWFMDASMSLYIFPVVLGAIWWGPWAALSLGFLALVPLAPHMFLEHGNLHAVSELGALAVVISFAIFIGWRVTREAHERRWLALLHTVAANATRGETTERIVKVMLDRMVSEKLVRAAWVYLFTTDGEQAVLTMHCGLSEEESWGETTTPPSKNASLWRWPAIADVPRTVEISLDARGSTLGKLRAELQGWRWRRSDVIRSIRGVANELAIAVDNRVLYEQERAAARELKESELRYRELFDRSRDAVLIIDRHGVVQAANQAAYRLVGIAEPDLSGRSVYAFLPDIFLDPALDGTQFQEKSLTQRTGDHRDVEIYLTPLGPDASKSLTQLILRDVTEQRLASAQTRQYVAGVTRAQEEERLRVARELHDDTVQRLVALFRQFDHISATEQLSVPLASHLGKMRTEVQETAAALRRLSQDLRPSVLDDLGLLAAVESLAERPAVNGGVATTVQVAGTPRRLPRDVEIGLFRIIQEAVTNASRHAEATSISVGIAFDESTVSATISDNGKGFNASSSLRAMAESGHLGLLGMKERADLLGAKLEVVSAPGQGAAVTVALHI